MDVGTTPLSLVLKRIATGIVCGCTIISLFFAIWTIVIIGGGPIIGVIVFQAIGLLGGIFLAFKLIFEREAIQEQQPTIEFV